MLACNKRGYDDECLIFYNYVDVLEQMEVFCQCLYSNDYGTDICLSRAHLWRIYNIELPIMRHVPYSSATRVCQVIPKFDADVRTPLAIG